eukprot:Transcript_865.p1 GENE.Transcript_865~~Transcript_865.p1  ORF type:complete len:493 (+),score=222.21 Transcript_865:96-1574(+)
MQSSPNVVAFSQPDMDDDQHSSDGLIHRRSPGTASAALRSVRLNRSNRRQSCTFFPPGFSNELKIDECKASGVTFQRGYDSLEGEQPDKVLMYDAAKVLSTAAPWRALFTKTVHATALTSNNILTKLLIYSSVATVFGMLSPAFEADAEEAIDALNNLMAAGLFFLLGPFVGNAVQRWWNVRRDCVGGLWGVVDDLSSYAAAWFHQPTTADREARKLVLRLGLCSHALLYKQARSNDEELGDLVRAGLLLPHEEKALQEIAAAHEEPSKAQQVWAWQTHFWTRALGGQLGTTPVPHAAMVMPLIMKRCMDGRGAIGTALAYIGTQQPFPYVHLLAVLTDLALAVNAMYVGLHTGRQLFVSRHCEAAQGGAACETPWQSESHLNVLLLVGFAGVRVAAFTLIYNGLLGIGVSLDNPIGDDPADLPGLAFQVFMKRECEGFGAAVDAVDLDGSKSGTVWWEGLGSAPEPRVGFTPHTAASKPRGSLDDRLGSAD